METELVPRSPEAVINSIGANVRLRRRDLGMTQQALARAADIDVRYLQRIERGQVNPSIGVLVAVANALEAEVEDLLTPRRLTQTRAGRPRT